jgi:hypothetical protein
LRHFAEVEQLLLSDVLLLVKNLYCLLEKLGLIEVLLGIRKTLQTHLGLNVSISKFFAFLFILFFKHLSEHKLQISILAGVL